MGRLYYNCWDPIVAKTYKIGWLSFLKTKKNSPIDRTIPKQLQFSSTKSGDKQIGRSALQQKLVGSKVTKNCDFRLNLSEPQIGLPALLQLQ